MHNAGSVTDDLDFLIVTAPRRVWTTRAAAIVIVRWARLFGVHLCPNYVLAETALAQQQDLFMAHEIAQMIPLSGYPLYAAMRDANPWTTHYLPNARTPFYANSEICPPGRLIQHMLENSLAGTMGIALNSGNKIAKSKSLRQNRARRIHPRNWMPSMSKDISMITAIPPWNAIANA